MMFKNLSKLFLVVLLFSMSALAETDLELVAPGGGEADLQKNIMKYYADDSNLVVVNWGNYKLEGKYLEYQRENSTLKGKGLIKLTQKKPFRVLRGEQIFADLNRDFFRATGWVKITYDETTEISGDSFEWYSQSEQFDVIGNVAIKYSGWKMTGQTIKGNLNSGFFTVFGPIQAVNMENSMRAGRMIFDRPSEKLTLLDNPVVINGKNELSATEIVYDFNTKKVAASGVVKSRVIE